MVGTHEAAWTAIEPHGPRPGAIVSNALLRIWAQ
jgi:hypothetical protein